MNKKKSKREIGEKGIKTSNVKDLNLVFAKKKPEEMMNSSDTILEK